MKTLPSDYVNIDNPLCLYCQAPCIKNIISNLALASMIIVKCEPCNEKIYYPVKGLTLGFTCMNFICSLDFIK